MRGRTPIAPAVVKPPRMSPAQSQLLSSVIILVLVGLILVMMVGMRLQNTGVGFAPPPGVIPRANCSRPGGRPGAGAAGGRTGYITAGAAGDQR